MAQPGFFGTDWLSQQQDACSCFLVLQERSVFRRSWILNKDVDTHLERQTIQLDSGIVAPTTDVVQDYPAGWDWRLVIGFVVLGIAALYTL